MKDKIKYFMIGIIFSLIIIFFMSAYNTGGGTTATSSIACSADGKIVYLADRINVYKSEDFGGSWKIITPK